MLRETIDHMFEPAIDENGIKCLLCGESAKLHRSHYYVFLRDSGLSDGDAILRINEDFKKWGNV